MQSASPGASSTGTHLSDEAASVVTTPRESVGRTSSTPSAIQRQPDSVVHSSIATRIEMTGTDAGVCGQVLVRAESGTSGLLVVDLVLEVDHPDSENRRRKLEEVSLHERAEPVVTGRHVLGPADRLTGRGLLRVVTPDMAAGGPCLDVGSPVLQVSDGAAAHDATLDGDVRVCAHRATSLSIGNQWSSGGTLRPATLAASSARRSNTASSAYADDANDSASSRRKGTTLGAERLDAHPGEGGHVIGIRRDQIALRRHVHLDQDGDAIAEKRADTLATGRAVLLVGRELVADVVDEPGDLELDVVRPHQRQLVGALQPVVQLAQSFRFAGSARPSAVRSSTSSARFVA